MKSPIPTKKLYPKYFFENKIFDQRLQHLIPEFTMLIIWQKALTICDDDIWLEGQLRFIVCLALVQCPSRPAMAARRSNSKLGFFFKNL